MTALAPSRTLGELVIEDSRAGRLFQRLGLDYCCGGRRTLTEACSQRGLDADTVLALLEAMDGEPNRSVADCDVAEMSISDLCEHILSRHHDPLRRDLPVISELLENVCRVHGHVHPQLLDLQRVFEQFKRQLEEHMHVEKVVLFPACRALAEGRSASEFDDEVLGALEHEHETTGAALQSIRALADDYRAELALCETHRELLRSLQALELDMYQHVHEENNLLFLRTRSLLAA